MLTLKSLLGSLLSPNPLGLALIALGAFLHWRKQRPKLRRVCFIAGVALPVIASNNGVGDFLIHKLERQHPAAFTSPSSPSPDFNYIAVLGGGHANNPSLPALSQLRDSSRARLVEAVRLMQLRPSAKLLVCGPRGRKKRDTHATVLAKAAAELGVSPQDITIISEVRDTHDEIHSINQIAGPQKIALVTSAWHMPRAVGLAQKAGLNVIACPADFLAPDPEFSISAWLTFSRFGAESTSRAIREFLGLTWTRLRGQR